MAKSQPLETMLNNFDPLDMACLPEFLERKHNNVDSHAADRGNGHADVPEGFVRGSLGQGMVVLTRNAGRDNPRRIPQDCNWYRYQ